MTVGLLICFAIALVVGALLWLAVGKARERLAAHHQRARLQALLKTLSEPAPFNEPSLIRTPLKAGWLALSEGTFLSRIEMPLDDARRWNKFAGEHPVEIAFAILCLVALSVVLVI
jgi:hypothetical protein